MPLPQNTVPGPWLAGSSRIASTKVKVQILSTICDLFRSHGLISTGSTDWRRKVKLWKMHLAWEMFQSWNCTLAFWHTIASSSQTWHPCTNYSEGKSAGDRLSLRKRPSRLQKVYWHPPFSTLLVHFNPDLELVLMYSPGVWCATFSFLRGWVSFQAGDWPPAFVSTLARAMTYFSTSLCSDLLLVTAAVSLWVYHLFQEYKCSQECGHTE